jgi:hypothetical protein
MREVLKPTDFTNLNCIFLIAKTTRIVFLPVRLLLFHVGSYDLEIIINLVKYQVNLYQ